MIEGAGSSDRRLRYSISVPPPTPSVQAEDPVGFDPSAGFHEFAYEWTPERVTFTLD